MADGEDIRRIIRILAVVGGLGGGGFVSGNAVDLFRVKEWQTQNVEQLMQAARDRDRMLALESQTKLLISLVEQCHGIAGQAGVILPSDSPTPDTSQNAFAPQPVHELEWKAIQ